MVDRWDDSDEETVTPSVPILPALDKKIVAPIVAKSLEETNIVANGDDGNKAVSDADDETSTSVYGIGEESDVEHEEDEIVISEFFDENVDIRKVFQRFTPRYVNIMGEFADVEIFLISLDGLLLELTAQQYLNWNLSGQTIVIANQVDRFLNEFSTIGGKFKLIWFTDLIPLYSEDTTLKYLRSFVSAYLLQSQWSSDIVEFCNPADSRWSDFLYQLTPSFLMLSVDNASSKVTDKPIDFQSLFLSLALHTLASATPVVHFNGLNINLCSVTCHRIEPVTMNFVGFESYLQTLWMKVHQKAKVVRRTECLSNCKSLTSLWLRIMVRCQGCRGTSKRFEALESAVLMASLVNAKRGTDRKYLCEANSVSQNIGVDTIGDRRVLLAACSSLLDSIDPKSLSFSLADLWDGRLILDIYDELVKNRPILPYRIQKDFAALHASLKMKLSIAVDTDDRLFDAPSEKALLLDDCDLLPVRNPVLTKYVSEYLTLIDEKALAEKPDVFDGFNRVMEWPFYVIEEKFLKPEKNDDTMQQQRSKNKARQHLSRWYELFSQSLEGRGSKLLVDFSRTPRGFASLESEENLENDKKKKQWQQKSKGIKGKKEPGKSKKDLILEMSKAKKNEKLIETEKSMIGYAVQQDQNAVESLANLMSKLELEESKALCVFEQVKRMYNQLADYEGKELIEERRFHSVQLVGKIKSIFTEYWSFLDERQKDFVTDLWTMLGFEKTAKIGTYTEDKFSLKINLIYYQLSYGGEIIDIQSDPRKDGRVTGFHPDAWQRLMLDAVDRNHSAIIIAPTSAGKTFVSYYCIEKVLRQSDEDMVVYVSPSKALLNQASGSIYARFRNKALSGGKCLMGNLTQEFSENAMNCQVLVTIPECLEELLLSPNPLVQQVVAKIKYVIFDEVHSISASAAAHIWEHLLLLIRCPFLALSATVGNAKVLHDWLQSAEQRKNVKEGKPRKVELIEYNERYSELELSLNCIKQDVDLTVGEESGQHEVLKHFMPYCVYKPEKLAMFGIPDDQQLTARQILDLYKAMASVDEKTRDDLEPCNFFNYKPGDKPVWLSRSDIRRLESALKRRLLDWLGTDRQKVDNVLSTLGTGVQSELDYRSRPFSQWNTVVKNITSVVLELRANNQLPAICFNDDRRVCERLALHVFNYFDAQQRDFENSAEFKIKYEIKDEDKLMKIARRKRDLKEATKKKKKTRNEWEEDGREEQEREGTDDIDPLAAKRMRLAQVLERFKLRSHIRDDDLYTKMTDRLTRYGGRSRESTALLLKLFERGIGFHHQGLSAIERGAVEILFRSGQLTLIFSTSTLALGMNMPCKTVIFGVDTMSLTPLQFRQMSGRAGRRGFDHSGTVIFMSIPTSKVRRLLTASLSTLRGNVPFTTSFVLRLFSFLHQQGTSHADEHVGDLKAEKLAYIQRLETVLTLLENSFILYTRENIADASRKQLKLFTLFSVELLRSLDLLNEKAQPHGLASVVCHLSAHEPGNLVFAHLLQSGEFHLLCKEANSRTELKSLLVLIFAHLFTYRLLPLNWNPNDKSSYPSTGDSEIFLRPLPTRCKNRIEALNKKVEQLYCAFMQLTDESRSLQGKVFSLTGRKDSSLSPLSHDIIRPFNDKLLSDVAFVPIHPLEPVDHRGRKIYLNAYAVDFWRSKSKKTLEKENLIMESEAWMLIHDFSVILDKISSALSIVGKTKDPFVEVMKELSEEYGMKMRTAFLMKAKS